MVEILNSTLSIPIRFFLKNSPPPDLTLHDIDMLAKKLRLISLIMSHMVQKICFDDRVDINKLQT